MSPNLVVFMFAGRQANMEVQWPYLEHILDQRPDAEVHLWDLTRDPVDSVYLGTLDGAHEGRVRVLRHLHPGHPIACLYPKGYPGGRIPRGWRRCTCIKHRPPYEQPYQWYAERERYVDTTFIKVDDDVLFLETHQLDQLLAPLVDYPDRVISANVVNNSVCAKYEKALHGRLSSSGPTTPDYDKAWWSLHTSAKFAVESHEWFLNEWAASPKVAERAGEYVRVRPGEAISINCVAFTHLTMKWIASQFEHDSRLGDEGVVDSRLPWIAKGFMAAHLTFGPQDADLSDSTLAELREGYVAARKGYLGE